MYVNRKASVSTITQALQVIRGLLLVGDERITIEAKEKGRYTITTMCNSPASAKGGKQK